MNNNRRRSFRPRNHKNGFRRRNGHSPQSQNSSFQISGNKGFKRNGIGSNPLNLEKTIQKFQQLAKDAQSQGDPVLVENYLQHADHYSRKLSEVNNKAKEINQKSKDLSTSEEKQIDLNKQENS
tara:strand:- start:249 stop:620 length:372 start_codon:yes stop_codon:yes gene_type:complete